MGLTLDVFAFRHPPPSEDELRAHVRVFAGSDYGLDGFDVRPAEAGYRDMPYRAELLCMMDFHTRAYACAFLLGKGAISLDPLTGEPRSLILPSFVERPWRTWPLWQRIRFRFRS